MTPAARLILSALATLLILVAYGAYTQSVLNQVRDVQENTIERNRKASLQLIRIQSDLNSLSFALRDMLEASGDYPLIAWRAQCERTRTNLEDALRREREMAGKTRDNQQAEYLSSSFDQFWAAMDQVFQWAAEKQDARAREFIRATLLPRQEALKALVARLLVDNVEADERAATDIARLYAGIERNLYLFLGLAVCLTLAVSLLLLRANRRHLAQIAALSDERQRLAQDLIANQEATLRRISRDLHDEFGQILTATGAMLGRARRLAPNAEFETQVREINETVQETLEKVRSLSQSLLPVILEEQGLAAAIEWYVATYQRQHGIVIHFQRHGQPPDLPPNQSIHLYRILQEALSNIARHARVNEAWVNWEVSSHVFQLRIQDRGQGFQLVSGGGMGLAAMRERAALLGAELSIESSKGGTMITVLLRFDRDSYVENPNSSGG